MGARQPYADFLRSEHAHHSRLSRVAADCGQPDEAAYQLGIARGYRYAWRRLMDDRQVASKRRMDGRGMAIVAQSLGIYR
jgi:hypothetical protein